MNMVPFIIAKAVHDKEKSRARAHARAKAEKETQAKLDKAKRVQSTQNSMNRQFIDTSSTDTIENLLHREEAFYATIKNVMFDHEDFSPLFTKLQAAIDEQVSQYIDAEHARLDTYVKPCATLRARYMDDATKLGVMGYMPGCSMNSRLWISIPKALETDPHAGYDTLPRYDLINGIPLTKKDIESGNNPYQDRYASYIAQHPDYESKYNELKASAHALAKRRMILAVSKKKQAEYEDIKKQLAQSEKIYNIAMQYKKEAAAYTNMPKEAKEILLRHFDTYAQLDAISTDVLGINNGTLRLNGYGNFTEKDTELVEDMIDKAISTLTKEEQDKLAQAPAKLAHMLCSISGPELFFKKFHDSMYYPTHKTSATSLLVDRIVNSTKPLIADRINKHHGLDEDTPTA